MTAKIGALVLHGFTSSLDTVNGLAPLLEAEGIPYRMPYLRGHGDTPEALRTVKWRDWVDDSAAALDDLLQEVDEAVVVGLSMGGLVTLTLLAERPHRLVGAAVVAPYLESADPLARFCEILAPVIRNFPAPKPPEYENYVCTNYTWFPTVSFVELYRFQKHVAGVLAGLNLPLLVLGANKDRVASRKGVLRVYDSVRSTDKAIKWFDKTGHEMMQGCEKDAVFAEIMAFVRTRIEARVAAARA